VNDPSRNGLSVDDRDFSLLWHGKVLVVTAVVLAVCLSLAWKFFLD